MALSWDSADESKMMRSFGFGRADFHRLIDLAHVFRSLGYADEQARQPHLEHDANQLKITVLICRPLASSSPSWTECRALLAAAEVYGNTVLSYHMRSLAW